MRFWHSSGNCTPPTLPHTSKKGIERQVKQLAPCYLLSCKFRPSPVQNFMLDRGEEPGRGQSADTCYCPARGISSPTR